MSSNFISPKIHEDREGPWQVRPVHFLTTIFATHIFLLAKRGMPLQEVSNSSTTSNPKDGVGMPLPLLIALFCLIKREVKTVWKVDFTQFDL